MQPNIDRCGQATRILTCGQADSCQYRLLLLPFRVVFYLIYITPMLAIVRLSVPLKFLYIRLSKKKSVYSGYQFFSV